MSHFGAWPKHNIISVFWRKESISKRRACSGLHYERGLFRLPEKREAGTM